LPATSNGASSPSPASHGDVYRVRAMDVHTALDNYDAVIANHGSGLLAKV